MMCNQVSQFVQQSALDFLGTEVLEPGIEHDLGGGWVGEPSGASHAKIPKNHELCGQMV